MRPDKRSCSSWSALRSNCILIWAIPFHSIQSQNRATKPSLKHVCACVCECVRVYMSQKFISKGGSVGVLTLSGGAWKTNQPKRPPLTGQVQEFNWIEFRSLQTSCTQKDAASAMLVWREGRLRGKRLAMCLVCGQVNFAPNSDWISQKCRNPSFWQEKMYEKNRSWALWQYLLSGRGTCKKTLPSHCAYKSEPNLRISTLFLPHRKREPFSQPKQPLNIWHRFIKRHVWSTLSTNAKRKVSFLFVALE